MKYIKLKTFIEYVTLFIIYGSVYCGIEIMYRDYTHWSMFIVGAICGICIGLVNELLSWETPIWKQILCGASTTITIEFIAGCILNLWLHMNVWDYSDLSCNILGQVCPQFFLIWCGLSLLTIVIDDYLRYFLFHEEKPRYKLR